MDQLPLKFFNQLAEYLPDETFRTLTLASKDAFGVMSQTDTFREKRKAYLNHKALVAEFISQTQDQLLTLWCAWLRTSETEFTLAGLDGVFPVLFHDYLVPELRSPESFNEWCQLNNKKITV